MNKNKKPKMTKNDLKTAKRLMKYVTEKYKLIREQSVSGQRKKQLTIY